jgi:hypothetical protein
VTRKTKTGPTIIVDVEDEARARAAIGDRAVVMPMVIGDSLILSAKSSFFASEWWDNPKLVEAALKPRKRGGKR